MRYNEKTGEFDYLYFNNGKPKKTYMLCLSREKIAEIKRLYGHEIIQCAGSECPYYAIGCGRKKLKQYENHK